MGFLLFIIAVILIIVGLVLWSKQAPGTGAGWASLLIIVGVILLLVSLVV
jgi:uncharacterized membrane protein YtjA (UPF0391 family)